jgi:hypothetical protein
MAANAAIAVTNKESTTGNAKAKNRTHHNSAGCAFSIAAYD